MWWLCIPLVMVVFVLAFWWWLRTPSKRVSRLGPSGQGIELVPEKAAEPSAPEVEVVPDDLKKIEGIGPKISLALQSAGITTFQALAQTEVARLQTILKEAKIRIGDPTTWPDQAALASEGKWSELKKLQGKLKGGRRP